MKKSASALSTHKSNACADSEQEIKQAYKQFDSANNWAR